MWFDLHSSLKYRRIINVLKLVKLKQLKRTCSVITAANLGELAAVHSLTTHLSEVKDNDGCIFKITYILWGAKV